MAAWSEQSTATASAAQISRILLSATLPRRSTRMAIETLSTESRFTADRSGTGSSPGSRRTSLARPRRLVVQGAMSARRRRGMAASRDRTTTGLRPISGISHHHTSPRAGSSVMKPPPRAGTRPGLPMRPAHRVGARRRWSSQLPPRPSGGEPTGPPGLRRSLRSLVFRSLCGRSPAGPSPRWCSIECGSCHYRATLMPHSGCSSLKTLAAPLEHRARPPLPD